MKKAPDFEAAAVRAAETLIKYRVSFAPVIPLPILKSMPNVLVQSFTEMSERVGWERSDLLTAFGVHNQDAYTFVKQTDSGLRYLIAYNQRMPFYIMQRTLARELGHIVLGHDGSRTDEVRTAEAMAFSWHFLCPRPLIRAIQDSGIDLTVEMLGNVTGCYERCLRRIHATPGVRVPSELNRIIREQFSDYVSNYTSYIDAVGMDDTSPLADFGTYMDGYEE